MKALAEIVMFTIPGTLRGSPKLSRLSLLERAKVNERSGDERNRSRLSLSVNKYNPNVSFHVRFRLAANLSHITGGSQRYGVELSSRATTDSLKDDNATDGVDQEAGAPVISDTEAVIDLTSTSGCLVVVLRLKLTSWGSKRLAS